MPQRAAALKNGYPIMLVLYEKNPKGVQFLTIANAVNLDRNHLAHFVRQLKKHGLIIKKRAPIHYKYFLTATGLRLMTYIHNRTAPLLMDEFSDID